ncbi:hypothetical protein BY458DRAFT_289942 [Sporodiniella umbellata]|nr:hypothetical protein BY458DRAFT_289942 [Sporodiniella umbellata]
MAVIILLFLWSFFGYTCLCVFLFFSLKKKGSIRIVSNKIQGWFFVCLFVCFKEKEYTNKRSFLEKQKRSNK